MAAQATLNPLRLQVAPGGEARTKISVTNNGLVVDSFKLHVLGPAAGWTACEPSAISLFPGQSGTAQIVVRPPVSSDVPYGPVPFAVRVVSAEDPAGSIVEEGLLDIGGLPQVTADLSPRTGRARGLRASRHRIAVDNFGNAPALVSLVGSDDADTVDVQVKPSELEVAPGAAALADVRVRARRRFWRGPQVTHRFRVTALPAGGDPIREDGSLLQEAAIPGWLPKAAALAIVAVVALAALWFALLRPVVRNTATSAGQSAAQQAVQQALQSSGPQNGSGGQPTPSVSSSSSATPTPTPTSAHHPPAPVPFAQTLTKATPSITEPSNHTLTITDLVFQNPAGDTGTLNLSLAGQVLFSEGLADFRDYDLHFVSPVTVPSGQTLSLSITCQNQGGRPCTSSVYVGGTSRTP